MALYVSAFWLPVALTIVIWAWGLVTWIVQRGDIVDNVHEVVRLGFCIIGTLVFWLAYFVAKAEGFA